MGQSRLKILLVILSAAAVLMLGGAAYGLDAPHINQSPFWVGCTSCHGEFPGPGATIEDTPINNLCRTCHNESTRLVTGVHKAEPHGSVTTGNNNRSSWSYDCVACHNPHTQRQPRAYRDAYKDDGSCLDEQVILSIDQGDNGTSNIVTVSGAPWQVDEWIGFVVQPDRNLDLYYYIIDNDISNLVVGPELDVSNIFGIWPGDTLGISYSKLIKDEITSGFPIVNGSGVTLEGGYARPVKLLNSVGVGSRAQTGNDTHAICVVCHTKTSSNNYAITKWRLQYVDQMALDEYDTEALAHTDGDDTCNTCHAPHESGFKPPAECGVCHGGEGAMDGDGNLVRAIRASGSESPTGTGAWDTVKIGAHFAHRDKGGVKCYECHQTGMIPTQINSSTPDVGDYYIDIGFNLREGSSHPNATDGTYSGRSAAQLDNSFLYNGYSFGPAGDGDGNIACESVYCHSDGGGLNDTLLFQADPTWINGVSAPLACDQCHGNDAADDLVTTDTHARHVASSTDSDYAYDCKYCHSVTVDYGFTINSMNKTKHADGVKDVVFANLSSGGSYDDPGASQCNNTYCHSNADPVGMSNNIYNTPTWDTLFGGARCRSCHSEQGQASPNWSAAHSEHVNDYSGRFTCQACHDSVATNNTTLVTPITEHVDGIKNVVFNASYDIAAGYDDGLTRCSGVSCHSTGQRFDKGTQYVNADWNAGTQECLLCHGGADTMSNMLNPATGLSNTHGYHIATDGYGDPARGSVAITCDMCHKGTTDDGLTIRAGSGITNHVNFISNNVDFDLSAINGSANGTWSAGTCNTTYCHGASLPYDSNSAPGNIPGTGLNPQWTDTGYIANASIADDCGQCHGFPPDDYTGGVDTHNGYKEKSDTQTCVGCHTHLNGDGTFNDLSKHIDGITQAISCGGCHGIPPDNATMVNEPGKGGTTGRESLGVPEGYHTLHATAGAGNLNYPCETCHTGGQPTSGQHNDSPSSEISMGFDVFGTQSGVYQAPDPATTSPANPNYSVVANAPTTYNTNAQRLCSAVYCHSDGGNHAGTQTIYQNANWDDGDGLACSECHGTGAASGNRKDYAITDYHPLHVDSNDSGYSFNCYLCHDLTVDETPAIEPGTGFGNHVDNEKDVVFATSGTDAIAKGGTWSTPQCSSTYCHSQGEDISAFTDGHESARWDMALPNGCAACHGARSTDANTVATKKHTKHVDGGSNYTISCSVCHVSTTADDTSIATASYHVNGIRNVTYGNISPVNSNTAGASAYVNDLTACSNTYCHSQGTKLSAPYTGTNVAPNTDAFWGTGQTLDCGGCHDDVTSGPDYPNDSPPGKKNSHVAHMQNAGSVCIDCHTATVDVNNSIIDTGKHVDGRYDVVNSTQFASYDLGTMTCSTVACHGNGNAVWGASLDCLSCHSGTEGGALGDGTPNGVNDEWTSDGHGGAAGGTLTSAARNGCDYCHDLSSGHTPTDSTNPYRLRFSATDNSLCLQCHNTGDPGIDRDSDNVLISGGLEDSGKDVGTAHFGGKHAAGEGGQFCWDCHDPHGVGTNILMVKDNVSLSVDSYGVPGSTVVVNFIDNSTAGPAEGRFVENTNSPRQGICQACHDPAKGDGSTKFWRWNGTDDPDLSGPTPPAASDHQQNDLCTTCHKHDGNFGGTGCTGCHNAPPTEAATGMKHDTHGTAEPSTYDDYSNNSTAGAYQFGCGKCHSGTGHPDNLQGSGTNGDPWRVDVIFDQTTDPKMSVSAGYARSTEAGPEQGPGGEYFSHTDGTCSNIYCHGDFPGGSNDSPTMNGTAACGTCHGASAASAPSGGAHAEHVGSGAGQYSFTCDLCHESVSDATPSVTDKSIHVDGLTHWDLDVINSRVGGSATYRTTETGSRAPDGTGGSCSNVKCHTSDGGSSFTAANWGDGTQGCGYCHNSGSAMATSAHNEHVFQAGYLGDNFGCVDCHSGTVSGDTTISTIANHVDMDGTPDVEGAYVGSYASPACNSSYCHSSGQETTSSVAVSWGNTLANDCKGCHGTTSSTSGEPDYGNGYPDDNTANSHLVHDRATTADCNKCHSGTVNGSGNLFSGTQHLDGVANVAGAGIGSYDEGTEECSNVNCHSSDGAGGRGGSDL
jgi:predicted CxxxxCH...CXXCH cytochrome family protein